MSNRRSKNKVTKNEDCKIDMINNKQTKNKKKSVPPPDDPDENMEIDNDEMIKILEVMPNNKLDKEFMEKCYVYGLPFEWKDEYTNTNVDIGQKKKISKIYNKAKKCLIEKSIQITDILKLTNITNEERCGLLERYAIMQSLDSNLYEYLKFRDELYNSIQYYKTRQTTFNELISIQNKKNELKKINLNSEDIEQKILKLNIDYYSQSQIYQKFLKLSSMGPMDSEYHKLKEWINTVIDIPFTTIKPMELDYALTLGCKPEGLDLSQNDLNSNQNINFILTQVKAKLDAEIYGMQQIKEELLLILNHRLCNPNASDHSIALIGPAGVGKTKIVRTLSSILNLPFEQISMGGINDGSFLDGHSYTYEGSRPGKIVECFKKLGCKNGILFFDEIDKIGVSSRSQEVSNQLLHITDFTQNTSFCDKYLPELPIDLSKIWFIFSLNDEKLIDPILKNRMNLIKVPGYSVNDKIQIINKFLIPQITKSLNMDTTKIILTDEIKKFIINNFSQEEGIRDLKRAIEALYRKLDILCKAVLADGTFGNLNFSFAIKNFIPPYTLNFQDINSLLKNYIKENKIPFGLYT
jgi:ATP-dependent Lon protease